MRRLGMPRQAEGASGGVNFISRCGVSSDGKIWRTMSRTLSGHKERLRSGWGSSAQ